jgi:negative regulator of sigma E activity
MVTGTHPEDVDLFDYVEGELSPDHRAELEVHLAGCATCAEQVALVQAGKDALRDSQLLHLPPARREAISTSLPIQRRAPRRSPALSPRRLLALLTPVAAVAAVVVVLVSSGVFETNGNEEGAGAGGGTAERTTQLDQDAPEASIAPFRAVAGPADQVTQLLRSKGIDARVANGRVEVRNATRSEVNRALGNRRAGGVEIVILN